MVCDDMIQLSPVHDRYVILPSHSSSLTDLINDINPLWEEFTFFELTEIMWQKGDRLFIQALNNLALGSMTDEDIKLIRSREVSDPNQIPKTAIALFATNKDVEAFNNKALDECTETEYTVNSLDLVVGSVSESVKTRTLDSLKKKKMSEVGGLPTTLRLKRGIKYMITSNIDVEDGLVNGACGVLSDVSLGRDGKVECVWLNFEPNNNVGKKAKASAETNQSWVPITKKVHTVLGNKEGA